MTKLPGLDRLLLGAVIALSVIGCVLVWSATTARSDLTGGDPRAYLEKQIVNVAIGLGLLGSCSSPTTGGCGSSRRWSTSPPSVGLVLVLTMGTAVNGSQSWLMLGGLSIQPSEFAKLAVVIGMALVVAERAEGRSRARSGPSTSS